MKISDVQELIKNVSKRELQTPILANGSTGIGKSYLVKELANTEGLDFVDLRLATQEVTDLIGIPRTIEEENEEPRTYWTKPVWFPKEGTRGILALEEVNRAPEDVRQAIFQLLTEWKLHTHVLPKGWTIVALINPDNGSYHVNQLDPAFKRRFVQLVVNPPDVTDWCIWAKKNKVSDSVIRFVAQFPKLLSKHEEIDIDAYPTPAGYHMLSTMILHNVIPSRCLHEVASGIVGIEAATTFVQSLKKGFQKPITAEEVLSNYKKVKKRHLDLVEAQRNDLIYATMVDIIATLDERKLKGDEPQNLHDYLCDCNAETMTTIVLRAKEKALGQLSRFEDLIEKIIEIKKSISDIK